MNSAGQVDVLVIGCGPAGAGAAIAAHDAGASVLVVEKRAAGGGNALFAGGFLWDIRGRDAARLVPGGAAPGRTYRAATASATG